MSVAQKIRDCRVLVPLIVDYYARPENGAGGSLHIVLDDGNVEDDSVAFCEHYAGEAGDGAGRVLARLLGMCSVTQRRKAIRLAHGIIGERWRSHWINAIGDDAKITPLANGDYEVRWTADVIIDHPGYFLTVKL